MSGRSSSLIEVVGVGLNPSDLPPRAMRIIEGAQVLAGGARLLAHFSHHPALKVKIGSPLSEAIGTLERESESGRCVVVLADGDPGFFGIGTRLLNVLGSERVRLHPNVTVLQAAASRIGTHWEDIRTVSLHGRKDLWPLRRALAQGWRVGVFTDPFNRPGRIAGELSEWGVEGYRLHVFEDLEQEGERIRSFASPEEAAGMEFSPLSFLLLERIRPPRLRLAPGLEEDRVSHQRGLITKREVRAVGLSLLGIEPRHVVWDLGAGSGAVALEASILAREGKVFAVEKDPERVRQIRMNIRLTGAYAVEPVQGRMPACLGDLPDPDRIFLGGGGEDVLAACMDRLRPGGRLAVHLVRIAALGRAVETLGRRGWPASVSQVQIHRSSELAGDLRLRAVNPVFVIAAERPAGAGAGEKEDQTR